MAFPDEEYSKYFVAGISRSITADDLRSYFTKFGTVVDAKVQKDQGGLSLGYGWVTFEKPNPDVLNTTHSLNGQQLSIQLPRARPPAAGGAPAAPSGFHVSAPAAPAAPGSGAPATASSWVPRAQHPSSDVRKRSRSRDHRDDHRRRSHSRSRHERHHHSHTTSGAGGYPPPPPGPPPAPVPQSAPSTVLPLGCDLYQPVEYMLCIPVSLCPPEYLRDRRVLFATLDHRTGHLAQAAPPPLGALPPMGAGLPPAAVVVSSAHAPVASQPQPAQPYSAASPYPHAPPIQIHVAHEAASRAVHHNHQQQQHHHLQLRLPHPQHHSVPAGHPSSSLRQHYDA